jgi:hypothetical protein
VFVPSQNLGVQTPSSDVPLPPTPSLPIFYPPAPSLQDGLYRKRPVPFYEPAKEFEKVREEIEGGEANEDIEEGGDAEEDIEEPFREFDCYGRKNWRKDVEDEKLKGVVEKLKSPEYRLFANDLYDLGIMNDLVYYHKSALDIIIGKVDSAN